MGRRAVLAGLACAGVPGALGGRASARGPGGAGTGPGPYGDLLAPDANGLMLPPGFTARVLAQFGQPVAPSDYVWHPFPDGGATFRAARGGGWVYVSNSEHPTPGLGLVSALRFDRTGEVVDAYRILDGTERNCAGGATPWGTWLSCEEIERGRVWECDPFGGRPARARPALGVFRHEGVAVDPGRRRLYLTEDESDGCLYRFTPERYPSLTSGRLEVAVVAADQTVDWRGVADPAGEETPTRQQVEESTRFNGGEGIWYERDTVVFTTKGDDRVWALDVGRSRLEVVYDPEERVLAPLRGVDNVVVTRGRDVMVAEDGGDGELVLISREGDVVPFLRLVLPPPIELAGPAYSPDGTRLYVSSWTHGTTFEVRGPFRQSDRPLRDTMASPRQRSSGHADDDDGLGGVLPLGIGAGGAALLGAAAAAWRLRTRRTRRAQPDGDVGPDSETEPLQTS